MNDIRLRGTQGDALGNVIRNEWAEDGTTLLLEAALANIREEIGEAFGLGKVRPFVEGEPIGVMQHRVLPTREPETPEQRWTRRQQEITYLREKNDRALARILED